MKRNVLLLALLCAVGLAICWPPSGTKGIRPTGSKEGRAVVNASLTTPRTNIGTLLGGASHSPEATTAAVRKQVAQNYGKLPLSFEPNAGEINGNVKFLSRGHGYELFLTADQAVLALREPGKPAPALKGGKYAGPQGPKAALLAKHAAAPTQDSVLRMSLLSANPNARVVGMDELPGKTNYFIGNDPKKWRTNVPTYAQVKYANVYPGVDLVYYGNQSGQLEYDFVVAPGADPAAIKLGVQTDRVHAATQHASALRLAANGDVMVTAYGGEVRFHKPVVYQLGSAPSASSRTQVDAHYVLTASNGVSFALGAYDRTRPLFIDPVLTYSTYLGGSANDAGYGIAVDSQNYAYVTGTTTSRDFPTNGTDQNFSVGGAPNSNGLGSASQIAFVTKLDPNGHYLAYSTYLGGSLIDGGNSIAVDAAGEAYVAGSTQSSDFPVTSNAYQPSLLGFANGFVTVLNSAGDYLKYSTYLGGGGYDSAVAIAVDTSGNAYVTGYTSSTNFPTANPIQATNNTSGGNPTAFVSELTVPASSSPGALPFSTYLGGTSSDNGFGIALDSSTPPGVYVTGITTSSDFNGANNTLNASGQPCVSNPSVIVQNAFVAKLHTSPPTLNYSTYLGGECADNGYAIAVDSSGDAYVTGNTTSEYFPIPAGQGFNNWGYTSGPDFAVKVNTGLACPTCQNAFVSELNPTGTGLIFSTYLGGSGVDSGNAIAVDPLGNMYVVGNTTSSDFPVNPTSS